MIEPIIYSKLESLTAGKVFIVEYRIRKLPVNFQNLVFFGQIHASKLTPGS